MKKQKTPRISVAPTIYQCLRAIDCVELLAERSDNALPIYVYAAIINNKSDIVQPTCDQVPDRWISGELWIRNAQPFIKIYKGYLSKKFDFPNVCYSSYAFTIEGDELPLDIITAPVIYGEGYNFSFIDIDPKRIGEAIDYAQKYPYIL